ncbi:CREB-regulated transcription coactivator 3 [Erpetoichthys calabaricus]|uniref:CREB-regulated transcription coactivator 3 n=1 Tax=Erpetoichthys calabaricus TaxID=27687 RepID=UPI0022344777|nr:CREB-regulated transcription coactivator 3 [Erpetoichthys calabaricus]
MSGSPGSGGSNPRKFSEKIALHNQKQAEETRAFEQLMTDITLSRVQFQRIQQMRLSQTCTQYGGSLPNVNQIGNSTAEFKGSFSPVLDNSRNTRHHGLVERVPRDRSRLGSPHRHLPDKHGRLMESSPYGPVYLSPLPDISWQREQRTWNEEKRPGFRLISQLNRTNSDSALHTTALNPNPQDPLCETTPQMGLVFPQRNASVSEAEANEVGDVFSFQPLDGGESHLGVNKPLSKQLQETKNVQSLTSRPKSCDVPKNNVFSSMDQNIGLSHFQGTLNSGGSLPDLTSLHFPPPLPIPLDPEDVRYPRLSGGDSTGNLHSAMRQLGFGNSEGISPSLNNPSLQAPIKSSHLQFPLSNPSVNMPLRFSSLPSTQPGGLSGSSRRRHRTPVSPLTVSPGVEHCVSPTMQFPSAISPSVSSIAQDVSLGTSNLPIQPPPPYPFYQQTLQQSCSQNFPAEASQQRQHNQHHQPVSPIRLDPASMNMDFVGEFLVDPFMDTDTSGEHPKSLTYKLRQFNTSENAFGSLPGGCCFNQSSDVSCSPSSGIRLGWSQRNLQDSLQIQQCFESNIPNIILTDESNPRLSKDISALAGVPECFDSESVFPLEDELHIEPLTLDGLNMLSDPDLILPDPSVEDGFRNDKL